MLKSPWKSPKCSLHIIPTLQIETIHQNAIGFVRIKACRKSATTSNLAYISS